MKFFSPKQVEKMEKCLSRYSLFYSFFCQSHIFFLFFPCSEKNEKMFSELFISSFFRPTTYFSCLFPPKEEKNWKYIYIKLRFIASLVLLFSQKTKRPCFTLFFSCSQKVEYLKKLKRLFLFQCPLCGKCFNRNAHLKRHTDSVHLNKSKLNYHSHINNPALIMNIH